MSVIYSAIKLTQHSYDRVVKSLYL